jgi:DNA-binding MarR family transcriptional regulator
MSTQTTDGDGIRSTTWARTEPQNQTGPPTDHPEHGVGFQLWRAANAWQRSINEALDPLGLTHVQFVLLASLSRIYRADGDVTQAALAREAGTDEMMTSQVARLLEARGLIERRAHPTDARAKSISMTESGAKILARAIDLVMEADRRFFATLDGELETLNAVLRRIVSWE